MDDLVITPFRDIVAQGRSAMENAGDDKCMVKAAQSLIEEGERALNKIDPLCRRYLVEYGFKFVEALKENDALADFRVELNELLWDFEDYTELDTFEPKKFAELRGVARRVAPKIYDMLMRMNIEAPTDNNNRSRITRLPDPQLPLLQPVLLPLNPDQGRKLHVGPLKVAREPPSQPSYARQLSTRPIITNSLIASSMGSDETCVSSDVCSSRIYGISTPLADHHGSPVSSGRSSPIPSLPNPLSPQSSFDIYKGFCNGAKEILSGGAGFRKTVKVGVSTTTTVGKCVQCYFEVDLNENDFNINKAERGNFLQNGIGYRLRFLQKSHLAIKRSDDPLYGCILCVKQARTLHVSDATVFTSSTLFAHLGRHPRPLPTIPGFTLIEQAEIPSRYKNDYDLHFKSPVERHPVVEKSSDICTMPSGTAKSTERRINGQRFLYDRTPALEMFQGARIVGVSWDAKYMGEWCFGWHDGVYASLPMEVLRLDPPTSAAIQMDETSLVQATARWKFKSKDRDRDGADVNWLKFDRGDIITHISWLHQEFWCWSGMNAQGRWGIFPQAFIDIETLRHSSRFSSEPGNVFGDERKLNVPLSLQSRFRSRITSQAGRPAGIARSISNSELSPRPTLIPSVSKWDDPSTGDNTQVETLPKVLGHKKITEYKNQALPTTKDINDNQNLEDDTIAASLNDDLLLDMKLEEVHQFGKCWTCSPTDSPSTREVPITISNVPVVIPVESRYPLRAPVSPPPDPHPKFINPMAPLADGIISEVFSVYEDALGFYLLINGQLQIIIPDDFDYEYALSHRPREFGGLEVSYIMESMTPTAGIASQVSEQVPQILTNTSLPPQSAPEFNAINNQFPATQLDTILGMTIGSAIQASVKGSKLKDRFEGRVGLMTRMGDRTFVTIPTHVVTSALTAAKSASFPGDSWINDVQIVSSNGNKELGPIIETFDPSAGDFPLGFVHDISLVDVSNAPSELVSNIKSPISTEWLSNSGWQEMRYRTAKLHLLHHASTAPSKQTNIKSIGLLECQCQAVGQGIFRMQQPPRTKRFSLRRTSTELDMRQDPGTWTSLVARSLLFRIHPDFRPDGAQSGTALCTIEELEDGTTCAKVAGFTAFAQDVSVVQNFDLEGPRLYSRLEQGRVAFYGAFQVPEALREKHHIM